MNTSRLTPIGNAFLKLIRSRWPELLDHARVDDCGSLVIEYASPHRSDAETLWISADADLDEIIIGFGGGHSHGGPWTDPDSPDHAFHASEKFLADLFAERVVGCTLTTGGGSIGYLDELRTVSWWGDVRAIRSWRGSHDWDAA